MDIKSRRMKRVGRVAHMDILFSLGLNNYVMKNFTIWSLYLWELQSFNEINIIFWLENTRGTYLEDLGVGQRTILKWIMAK
jgi:hypothetical protein